MVKGNLQRPIVDVLFPRWTTVGLYYSQGNREKIDRRLGKICSKALHRWQRKWNYHIGIGAVGGERLFRFLCMLGLWIGSSNANETERGDMHHTSDSYLRFQYPRLHSSGSLIRYTEFWRILFRSVEAVRYNMWIISIRKIVGAGCLDACGRFNLFRYGYLKISFSFQMFRNSLSRCSVNH